MNTYAQSIRDAIDYMDDSSAAAAERLLAMPLTDADLAAIERAASFVCAAGSECLPGVDCDISLARESLGDFMAARTAYWCDRGSSIETGDSRILAYRGVQAQRGARRVNIAVVELGDHTLLMQVQA